MIDKNKTAPTFSYAGFTYKAFSILEDDDTLKVYHELHQGNQYLKSIDWTPYEYMTFQSFCDYVDLGMPRRRGIGPLDKKDLDILKSMKFTENVLTPLHQ